MNPRTTIPFCTKAGLALAILMLGTPVMGITIQDTYSRPDDTDLGVTEVGSVGYTEAYTAADGPNNVADILSGELRIFGYSSTTTASTPGLVLLNASGPDATIAADMHFSYPNGQVNSSSYNSGGFLFRRNGASGGYSAAANEGMVEVQLNPGATFLIREVISTSTNNAPSLITYSNPFTGGGASVDYSAPGSLPAMLGGLPFDVNQNGILDENEPFRLGASLIGDQLSVSINGQDLFNLTTTASTGLKSLSNVGFYKNRLTSGGTRDVAHSMFDNIDVTIVPEPNSLAIFIAAIGIVIVTQRRSVAEII